MKRILFILLIISCKCQAQIRIIEYGATQTTTTNASAFGYGPTTFTAGRLYLFIGITTGTTNPGSISATTLTWTSVISTGNSTRRIQVFRCIPVSTVSSENVSLGTFGGGSTGYHVQLLEITGIDYSGTNGENAIVQAVASSGSGADPSISMSAFDGGKNSGLVLFCNDVNPFTGTAESGWTEYRDEGHADPTTGYYAMYRHSTTDNTPTVTSSASNWIGVGIELSARRIIFTN